MEVLIRLGKLRARSLQITPTNPFKTTSTRSADHTNGGIYLFATQLTNLQIVWDFPHQTGVDIICVTYFITQRDIITCEKVKTIKVASFHFQTALRATNPLKNSLVWVGLKPNSPPGRWVVVFVVVTTLLLLSPSNPQSPSLFNTRRELLPL